MNRVSISYIPLFKSLVLNHKLTIIDVPKKTIKFILITFIIVSNFCFSQNNI